MPNIDHQVTEDHPPGTQLQAGMFVTAFAILFILGLAVWPVA
jgi:hypothetical protein